MPKRRIASGSTLPALPEPPRQHQAMTPNLLFNRLHSLNDEVNAISEALINPSTKLYDGELNGNLSPRPLPMSEEIVDLEESEEEDDDCTGCRDWLENVKNKKKRKIPTSAVMGHPGGLVSPVHQNHSHTGVSPARTSKQKTRRRRTWDVSSEARPDTSFKVARDGATSAVFSVRSGLSSF